MEEAPGRTDCLTAIHYIFREHIDLFVDWIGNMPRSLAKGSDWKVYEIDQTELEPGDLIFLQHKRSCRTVTHIAVALSLTKLFHCSYKKGGAIETLDELFASYTQPAIEDMLSYTDHRTISSDTSPGHDGKEAES